jgi:uncharacterized protein YaeQ
MALGAKIFKAQIAFSNFVTHQYDDINLTMAMHPSENEGRMMARLATYLFFIDAENRLEFTKGLSTSEEPEIWSKNFASEIEHWIELGEPDEKRLRQAAGKSQNVAAVAYHASTYEKWFDKVKGKFIYNDKVGLYFLDVFENGPLDNIVEKSMRLSCTIDEGQEMYLGNDDQRIGVRLKKLL